MNILWKFHSGLHELIIIVFAATGNALAKVTSLQGTAEEDAERWEKCQGKVGLQTACISKGSVRCTYRLDGVLVNFGLHLPQMMPIYRQKNMMWHLWHYDSLYCTAWTLHGEWVFGEGFGVNISEVQKFLNQSRNLSKALLKGDYIYIYIFPLWNCSDQNRTSLQILFVLSFFSLPPGPGEEVSLAARQ